MISLWSAQRAALESNFTSSQPPLWSFSRASQGTQINGGVLSYAPNNLLLQSQTFTTASWTKNAVAVAVSGTAPDGSATANLATDDTSTGAHSFYGTAPLLSAGSTYTLFAHFKAGTQRYISMRGEAVGSASNWPWLTLDTTLGTITNNGVAGTYAVAALSNGWYRVSMTFVSFSTVNGNAVFAGSNVSTAPPANYSLGWGYTGTSLNWAVWGAQLEQNSTMGTYNPTTTAAYYGPRFEDTPAAGYLNEPQATNLILQSSTLTNASWTKSGLAVTTSGTAPDGVASTANLATEDTSLAAHYITGTGFATTASTTYIVSAFIKAGTQRYVSVRGEASGLIATYPWITLDTTLGTLDANSLALTPTVRAISNGFYLVSFTFVAFGIASGGNVVFAGSDVSTAPMTASLTGASYTGTSKTWSAWGAMLAASAVPTSLVQTTTTAATRAADNLTFDLTQLPGLQTPSGYAAAIDFSSLSNAQAQVVFGFSGSGGFSNTWYFGTDGLGNIGLTTIVAGVGVSSSNYALRAPGLTNKIAVRVLPTGVYFSLNGAAEVFVANAGMPVMTTAAVMRAPWGAGNYYAGHATLVTMVPGPQSAAWSQARST